MEGAVGKKRVKKIFNFFNFFYQYITYVCITGPFPTDCNMYNTVYVYII